VCGNEQHQQHHEPVDNHPQRRSSARYARHKSLKACKEREIPFLLSLAEPTTNDDDFYAFPEREARKGVLSTIKFDRHKPIMLLLLLLATSSSSRRYSSASNTFMRVAFYA